MEIAAIFLNFMSVVFGFLLSWAFPPFVQQAFDWLFSPLRFFGYFIDLHYLGTILVSLFGFLLVWWSYQVARFAFSIVISMIHGDSVLEQPEL